ncbi:50S ribosomal protein L11 methyltransferase, partial [candidate division FCPU426 bacterium]|nr:50S ribosomal protein L11 methyltransferase [candidate division FCPU426 bacterium]
AAAGFIGLHMAYNALTPWAQLAADEEMIWESPQAALQTIADLADQQNVPAVVEKIWQENQRKQYPYDINLASYRQKYGQLAIYYLIEDLQEQLKIKKRMSARFLANRINDLAEKQLFVPQPVKPEDFKLLRAFLKENQDWPAYGDAAGHGLRKMVGTFAEQGSAYADLAEINIGQLTSLLRSRENIACMLGLPVEDSNIQQWNLPYIHLTWHQYQALQTILREKIRDGTLAAYGDTRGEGLAGLFNEIRRRPGPYSALRGINIGHLTGFLNSAERIAGITGNAEYARTRLQNWKPPKIDMSWNQYLALQRIMKEKYDQGVLAEYGTGNLEGLVKLVEEIETRGGDYAWLRGVSIGHLTTLLDSQDKVAGLIGISPKYKQLLAWNMSQQYISYRDFVAKYVAPKRRGPGVKKEAAAALDMDNPDLQKMLGRPEINQWNKAEILRALELIQKSGGTQAFGELAGVMDNPAVVQNNFAGILKALGAVSQAAGQKTVPVFSFIREILTRIDAKPGNIVKSIRSLAPALRQLAAAGEEGIAELKADLAETELTASNVAGLLQEWINDGRIDRHLAGAIGRFAVKEVRVLAAKARVTGQTVSGPRIAVTGYALDVRGRPNLQEEVEFHVTLRSLNLAERQRLRGAISHLEQIFRSKTGWVGQDREILAALLARANRLRQQTPMVIDLKAGFTGVFAIQDVERVRGPDDAVFSGLGLDEAALIDERLFSEPGLFAAVLLHEVAEGSKDPRLTHAFLRGLGKKERALQQGDLGPADIGFVARILGNAAQDQLTAWLQRRKNELGVLAEHERSRQQAIREGTPDYEEVIREVYGGLSAAEEELGGLRVVREERQAALAGAALRHDRYLRQIPRGLSLPEKVKIKGLVLDVDSTLTENATSPIEPEALAQIKRALKAGIPVLLSSGSPGEVGQMGRLYRSADKTDFDVVFARHETHALQNRIVEQIRKEMQSTGDGRFLVQLEIHGNCGAEMVFFDQKGYAKFTRNYNLEVLPQDQIAFGRALAIAYLRVLARNGLNFSAAISALEHTRDFALIRQIFETAVRGHTTAFFFLFNTEVNISAHDSIVDGREVLQEAKKLLQEEGYQWDQEKYFPTAGGDFAKFSRVRKVDAVRQWALGNPQEGVLLLVGDSHTDDFLYAGLPGETLFPFYLGKAADMADEPQVIVARDQHLEDNAGFSATARTLANFLDAQEKGLSYTELPFFDNQFSLMQLLDQGIFTSAELKAQGILPAAAQRQPEQPLFPALGARMQKRGQAAVAGILQHLGFPQRGLKWKKFGNQARLTRCPAASLDRENVLTAFDLKTDEWAGGEAVLVEYGGLPMFLALVRTGQEVMVWDFSRYYGLSPDVFKALSTHLQNRLFPEAPLGFHQILHPYNHVYFEKTYGFHSYSAEDKKNALRLQGFNLNNLVEHIITVFPGVYHGHHPSAEISARAADKYAQAGKEVLVVGTGQGLETLVAVKNGARVEAVDLKQMAVANTRYNLEANGLDLDQANLFAHELIPAGKTYDVIVFNMPQVQAYAKGKFDALSPQGQNVDDPEGEILEKTARQLSAALRPGGTAILVNTESIAIARKLEAWTGLKVQTDFFGVDGNSQAYIMQKPETEAGIPEKKVAQQKDAGAGDDMAEEKTVVETNDQKTVIHVRGKTWAFKPTRISTGVGVTLNLESSPDNRMADVIVYHQPIADGTAGAGFRGVSIEKPLRDQGLLKPLLNLFFQTYPRVRQTHPDMKNLIVLDILMQEYGFAPQQATTPSVWVKEVPKDSPLAKTGKRLLVFFENHARRTVFQNLAVQQMTEQYKYVAEKDKDFRPLYLDQPLVVRDQKKFAAALDRIKIQKTPEALEITLAPEDDSTTGEVWEAKQAEQWVENFAARGATHPDSLD